VRPLLLLLAILLALCVPSAAADPLSRLKEAHATVLRAQAAGSATACREATVQALVALGPSAPPEVRRLLEDAQSASWPDTARQRLHDAARTLENGLNAAAAPASSDDALTAARARLTEILQGPEFKRGRFFDEILRRITAIAEGIVRWIAAQLGFHFKEGSGVFDLLFLALCVLAAILIALLAVLLLRRLSQRSLQAAPTRPQGEVELLRTTGEWLKWASDHARDGDYRRAVRCAYLAMLHRLQDLGLVDLERGHTNWEILRALRPNPAHADFDAATRLFERHWYALCPAAQEDYEEMLRLLHNLDGIGATAA